MSNTICVIEKLNHYNYYEDVIADIYSSLTTYTKAIFNKYYVLINIWPNSKGLTISDRDCDMPIVILKTIFIFQIALEF